MITALDRRSKHLRLMATLRQKGPLRFLALQKAASLHAPEVDRILKELLRDGLVLARTVPSRASTVPVEYFLGKKGLLHLGGVDAYRAYFVHHRDQVDARVMEQLDQIYA